MSGVPKNSCKFVSLYLSDIPHFKSSFATNLANVYKPLFYLKNKTDDNVD